MICLSGGNTTLNMGRTGRDDTQIELAKWPDSNSTTNPPHTCTVHHSNAAHRRDSTRSHHRPLHPNVHPHALQPQRTGRRSSPSSRQFVYIPGGSAGLGKALAAELVRRGAHVVIVARDMKRADETVQELKVCSSCARLTPSEHRRRDAEDLCSPSGPDVPCGS